MMLNGHKLEGKRPGGRPGGSCSGSLGNGPGGNMRAMSGGGGVR